MPLLRDDDVFLTEHPRTGVTLGDVSRFVEIHEMLGGREHHIGVIASEIANAPALAEYILRQKNVRAELHGWTHVDHSTFTPAGAIASLQRGISAIGYHFGRKPEWFFPPWNKTSPALEQACADVGLRLDASCLTPQKWLAGERGPIVSFHYWHAAETEALKECIDRDLL